MPLNADATAAVSDLAEPRTGRYCSICDEQWHAPYAHKSGEFWHVPASSGAYYLIRNTACTCPSFYFGRRPCKHIKKVRELEAAGKKHDLTHRQWLRLEHERWARECPEDPTIDDLLGSIG